MAGVNYQRLAQTAARMIRENGRPVTIERPAKGAYNPTTGETDFGGGDGKPQVFQTRGVQDKRVYKTVVEGSLITVKETVLMLDGRIKPEPSDRIFMDGKKVADIIDPVEEISPGGVDIYYEVRLEI
jgi:hypothetical protein